MITTHIVIVVLKVIYRGWVWHQANILTLIIPACEYSTSIAEYRDFGYYHHGADIANTRSHITPDAGSSNQSSQPTGSHTQAYYYPYENYTPGFYTYRGDYDNDEFVPHQNSRWK